MNLTQQERTELLTILNMSLYDADVAIGQSHDVEEVAALREHKATLRKWIHRFSISEPQEPDETPESWSGPRVDWRAIEAQAKVDLEAIATDKDAYAFIEKYLSRELRPQLVAIYRSTRHEMGRTPRQAIDTILSLPPL